VKIFTKFLEAFGLISKGFFLGARIPTVIFDQTKHPPGLLYLFTIDQTGAGFESA